MRITTTIAMTMKKIIVGVLFQVFYISESNKNLIIFSNTLDRLAPLACIRYAYNQYFGILVLLHFLKQYHNAINIHNA